MPVLSSELRFHRAATASDAAANGGRMTNAELPDNVKNALFPDVTEAERAAGLARWRKLYVKNANADNLSLGQVGVCLARPASGDPRVTLCAGTQTDTQADLSSPVEYGAAALEADVAAGATSFAVLLEHQSQAIFRDNATIRIGTDSQGEYFAGVSVSQDGTRVTIQLADGHALATSYSAASAAVASVHEAGDLEPGFSGWSETSVEGVYDESTYPVELDNQACVQDAWTIVFTSATAFSCSGAATGALAPGSTDADYAPTNPDFGRPYFTLRAAGWSGTWASGNTLIFTTSPAALPLWLKQVTPAGAAATASSAWRLVVRGEA